MNAADITPRPTCQTNLDPDLRPLLAPEQFNRLLQLVGPDGIAEAVQIIREVITREDVQCASRF